MDQSQPGVAPETQPTPTPTPVAVEPTPQAAARAQVYQQYYGTSPQSAAPPVAPEPTAQVEPAQEPQPGGEVPPTPPSPDLAATLVALQQEIAALKGQLATPPQPTPPPVSSTPPEAFHEQWLTLMRAGETAKAMELLETHITERTTPQATQQAVEQAVERMRMEQEIDRFVTTLRDQNPDLAPLEELISVKAQARLEQARNAGRIRNGSDFVREYKSAVNAEVEETRKLVQQYRGAGKAEATTVQRQVVASQPIPPQPITSNREPAPPTSAESPQDYLAKRMALTWQRRGIPPTPQG